MTGDIKHNDIKYINQLRHRMKGQMSHDILEDDNLFRRFLIARDYDLNAAEEMLKKNLAWRKTNKIDSLLTDYTFAEAAEKFLIVDWIGFDKAGRPLYFCNIGEMDMRGIIKSVKKIDILKYICHIMETSAEIMKIQSKKLNKVVDTVSIIFDVGNFTFATATHKPTISILLFLIQGYESYYPEWLSTAYLINMSNYFKFGLQLLKPVIAGRTFQKIKIFGKDGWKNELLRDIDAETLPAFLGGTRTDPDGDPLCKTVIHACKTVPESYFIVKKNYLSENPDAKKIIVSRLSKVMVTLIVLYPGSNIEYEFETRSRDIAFSVLYKESTNSEPEEIIVKERIDTDMDSESGIFNCERSGIYILEFNNTYSWFHRKEVYYIAKVVGPDIVNTNGEC